MPYAAHLIFEATLSCRHAARQRRPGARACAVAQDSESEADGPAILPPGDGADALLCDRGAYAICEQVAVLQSGNARWRMVVLRRSAVVSGR